MSKKILLFGGSGFIGSSLTKALLEEKNEVCVICQNKENALKKFKNHPNLQIKTIDIFNENELRNFVKNYEIVINLIGKLFETKKGDFAKFHHYFPNFLSKNLSNDQILIHISALGIEKSSKTSIYAKTKLDGENSIINNSKNYNIIKPSIVFGKEDNFFNQFAKMAQFSPFLPLIGGGKAKFSPIYVEDITKSIVFLIKNNEKYQNKIFEAYGNKTVSFKDLMKFILRTTNKKRLLLNLPFSIAKFQAKFINFFKIYLLTADQVELLKYDNVSNGNFDNIDKIIGDLKSYEEIVPEYIKK